MIQERVCCKDRPIILRGCLAYICEHTVPATVRWPDGIFATRSTNEGTRPITLRDLNEVGPVWTQRFGRLKEYRYKGVGMASLERGRTE